MADVNGDTPKRTRGPQRSIESLGFELPPELLRIYSLGLDLLRPLSTSIAVHGYRRPDPGSGSCVQSGEQGVRWTRDRRPPGFERLQPFVHDPTAYARVAITLSYPLAVERDSLPPHVEAAVDAIIELNDGAPQERLRRMQIIREVTELLAPVSAAIMERCPHRSEKPSKNPAVWCALIDALGLPCVDLVGKLFNEGFSVVGTAKDTGLWRLKNADENVESRPQLSLDEFRQSRRIYAGKLQHRMDRERTQARADAEVARKARAAYDASLKEVNVKLSAMGPFSLADIRRDFVETGPKAMCILPRFPVEKENEQGSFQVRPCDDGRFAETNMTFQSLEKVSLMPPNFTAAVAHRTFNGHISRHGSCSRLGQFGRDEMNAYRNCPPKEPELNIVACLNAMLVVVYFVLLGLAFGLAGSVNAFCEKSSAFAIIAADMLLVPVAPYIDDFTGCESRASQGPGERDARGVVLFPGSAEDAMDFLADILGVPFSGGPKRKHWSTVGTSCGVESDLRSTHTSGEIGVAMKRSTRRQVSARIRRSLLEDSLTPVEAGSLKGKLAYLFFFDKTGRAALQPLSAREHQRETDDALNDSLRSALVELDKLLSGGDRTLPPVTIFPSKRAPGKVVIFSDAAWDPGGGLRFGRGGIAYVAFLPEGRVIFAYMIVPEWVFETLSSVKQRKSFICPLEEMGIAAPYFNPLLEPYLRNCDVIHFADNTAANGAASKSYSSSPDLARIVHAFSVRKSELGSRVWIEYVPSEANLADGPTRPEREGAFDALLQDFGAVEIEFVMPPILGW